MSVVQLWFCLKSRDKNRMYYKHLGSTLSSLLLRHNSDSINDWLWISATGWSQTLRHSAAIFHLHCSLLPSLKHRVLLRTSVSTFSFTFLLSWTSQKQLVTSDWISFSRGTQRWRLWKDTGVDLCISPTPLWRSGVCNHNVYDWKRHHFNDKLSLFCISNMHTLYIYTYIYTYTHTHTWVYKHYIHNWKKGAKFHSQGKAFHAIRAERFRHCEEWC